MFEKKDYSNLTFEALLAEQKKLKRNELFSAGFIGVLIGIMFYGIIANSFGFFKMYIIIPLLLMLGIVKNSQVQKENLKKIEEEIVKRNQG